MRRFDTSHFPTQTEADVAARVLQNQFPDLDFRGREYKPQKGKS